MIRTIIVDFKSEKIIFDRGIVCSEYKMTLKRNAQLLAFVFKNNLQTHGSENYFLLDLWISGYYPLSNP